MKKEGRRRKRNVLKPKSSKSYVVWRPDKMVDSDFLRHPVHSCLSAVLCCVTLYLAVCLLCCATLYLAVCYVMVSPCTYLLCFVVLGICCF